MSFWQRTGVGSYSLGSDTVHGANESSLWSGGFSDSQWHGLFLHHTEAGWQRKVAAVANISLHWLALDPAWIIPPSPPNNVVDPSHRSAPLQCNVYFQCFLSHEALFYTWHWQDLLYEYMVPQRVSFILFIRVSL